MEKIIIIGPDRIDTGTLDLSIKSNCKDWETQFLTTDDVVEGNSGLLQSAAAIVVPSVLRYIVPKLKSFNQAVILEDGSEMFDRPEQLIERIKSIIG